METQGKNTVAQSSVSQDYETFTQSPFLSSSEFILGWDELQETCPLSYLWNEHSGMNEGDFLDYKTDFLVQMHLEIRFGGTHLEENLVLLEDSPSEVRL